MPESPPLTATRFAVIRRGNPRGVIRCATPRAIPVAALVLAGLLVGCTEESADAPQPATPTAAAQGGGLTLEGVPALVARVEPSVVTVFTDDGLGSGVVAGDGEIVITNEHVVRGADQVELALADGERLTARVLATDAYTDLAVLEPERTDLPPAQFRDELPQLGEPVLAVGSPLGFHNSVTLGIVSEVGREIPGAAAQSPALVDLIQTDAAISPGNSGGALVDAAGRVVGINDAYLPPETGAVSIGFAIPSPTVLDVVADLRDDGEVTHSFVGILPGQVTPELAQALGLPVEQGVLVREVVPDGPAAAAGLQPGDLITAFAGEPTDTVEAFLGALRGTQPGDTVPVEYFRDGEGQQADLTVAGIER